MSAEIYYDSLIVWLLSLPPLPESLAGSHLSGQYSVFCLSLLIMLPIKKKNTAYNATLKARIDFLIGHCRALIC